MTDDNINVFIVGGEEPRATPQLDRAIPLGKSLVCARIGVFQARIDSRGLAKQEGLII
jgi:hypothetical protein